MGMGTYGSRSGAVGMSAIFKAIDKVDRQGKKVAAHVLEADEADIVFEDGNFTVKGTAPTSSISAPARCRPMSRTISWPGHGAGSEGRGPSTIRPTSPSRPVSYICELEIDPDTGKTRIERSSRSTISATSSTR
jgi:carbon-monoxide dehydrogenase large subunit